MKTDRTTLVWLSVVCLIAAHIPLRGEVSATAVKVSGTAESRATKAAPWRGLAQDAQLGSQSWVRTREQAQVVLKFENDAAVTIHEMSQVYLKSLTREADQPQSTIGLIIGKLWAKVRKNEDRDRGSFTIYTPAAIAAVRGTDYFIESDGPRGNSRIGVWDGVVAVRAVRGGPVVEVPKGHVIEVVYNQPVDRNKLLQMEQGRLREQQQLNENLDSLGLTNILGAGSAAVEMAKIDAARTESARQEILAANAARRGEEVVREDFKKIERALARLYADTQFIPGDGVTRKTSRKEDTLTCLLENNNGEGGEIEGWSGPYLEGNLQDPWGEKYGVYQRKLGPRFAGLMLHSQGPNASRGDDDDIEVYLAKRKLETATED